MRKSLVIMLSAVLILCSVTQAFGTGKIYWTDDAGQVSRANTNGTGSELLVSTGSDWLNGIALNGDATKMYWTDRNNGKIQRANIDGSNVEDLITGLINPQGIAFDPVDNKLYWTTDESAPFASDGKIQQANEDGSNIEDLVFGLRYSGGIAIARSLGKMYWTELFPASIRRADLDGGSVEDVVTIVVNYPYGIVLDMAAGKMYWTDNLDDMIMRADLDGSNREMIVTGNNGYGIALNTLEGKLYWASYDTNEIYRANLDGSGVEMVVNTGSDGPVGLVSTGASDIPTVSTWGMVITLILLLTAGMFIFRRHSRERV